ncbi:MAG: hypothetical protein IT261_13280 [Saprospiraceae bacterium]|nr:hypothetical protein [Saprospiraceae bacterium]
MKLLQLLRILTPADHKNLERFLQSPYFKPSDRFLPFYRQLKKKYPDFDSEKEGLIKVYQTCFGKESYSDSKLYNLMSDMARQLERFLTVEAALGPENLPPTDLEEHLLITSLGRRNAGAYFRDEAEAFIQKLESKKAKGPEEWYFLQSTQEHVSFNADTPVNAKYGQYFSNAVHNLLLYTYTSYLRYAAEWKSRGLWIGRQETLPHLDFFLSVTGSQEILEKSPLLEIYRTIVLTFKETNSQPDFELLVRLFEQIQDIVPIDDRKTIIRHILNYGIRLMSKEMAIEADLFEIYRKAEALDILLDQGRMSLPSFINVVQLGSKLKDFSYVEGFISRGAVHLDEEWRKHAVQFAQSIIRYHQGELDAAQDFLTPEVFRIPRLELLPRFLLVRIAFDRFLFHGDDDTFLLAQLDALGQFVKNRKELSEHKIQGALQLIKMIRAVAKEKGKHKRVPEKERSALLKKAQATTPLVDRIWLIERIEKL